MEADRIHPTKRRRPFAAGDLSPQAGILLLCVLLFLAASIALRLPSGFAFWLGAYFATTLAYSLVLKKLALVDVITLAGLYTVRMVAGASVTEVAFSPWLGGFSVFFFLSLAIVKRYAELDRLDREGQVPASGRGYHVEDIEQLRSFGTASGYASVVVFTLYINNPAILELYGHFQRLWLLIPVLILWINRVWLLAHRGELDEDPVVFALKDGWSAVLGVMAMLIVLSSI
jgi:4-hydroxybenzoate polyprenyltransferase